MRNWPQDAKQALRFLAAARYFLPEYLDCPENLVAQYKAHLRQSDFQSALELLEQIGDLHTGCENELNFWKELYYVAKHLDFTEHAARYEERLRQITDMQRLGW